MRGALAGLAAVFLASAAHAQIPQERAVLDELNRARTNPAAYADTLRLYRTYLAAGDKIARIPGDPVGHVTTEGAPAVDEAIAFVLAQPPLPPLQPSDLLRLAAQDHVRDQGPTGALSHNGSHGETPGDRVMKRGGGKYLGEIIAYGAADTVSVVRQFIIDDGVANRGHRALIFEPRFAFIGVACGPHKALRTMCVGDMAVSADATR